MKNSIMLAAVLLGLGAGSASAYSHSVKNTGNVTVHFWINYKACSNDSWDIKPGETITWRSGWCCITEARASMDDVKSRRVGSSQAFGSLAAEPFVGTVACSNTNWTVAGDKGGADKDDFAHIKIERL